MYVQVRNKIGKILPESHSRPIRDAVHNGLDTLEIDGKTVRVVETLTTDVMKIITIEF